MLYGVHAHLAKWRKQKSQLYIGDRNRLYNEMKIQQPFDRTYGDAIHISNILNVSTLLLQLCYLISSHVSVNYKRKHPRSSSLYAIYKFWENKVADFQWLQIFTLFLFLLCFICNCCKYIFSIMLSKITIFYLPFPNYEVRHYDN